LIFSSVRAAEDKVVASRLDKEYAGITGVPTFTTAAAELNPVSNPLHNTAIVWGNAYGRHPRRG
jgi:aspartate/tyrosine/aromatic aminotransferase